MTHMTPDSSPGRLVTFVVVGLLSIGMVGCGDPCSDLADLTCRTVGVSSPDCAKARSFAKSAPPEERRVCTQALELVKTLKR